MSRLFILLLIALLPLRGWSVERMAVQMQAVQGKAAHARSQMVDSAMSAECALLMQRAAATAASQADTGAGQLPDHKGCQSCQLCMPLAALAVTSGVVAAANPQGLPASRSSRFASAERARDAKPPIS